MAAPSGFDVTDEYMHEPTDHPQFNESMYFNFVDGNSGLATLIRMGNRANEGRAEVTVLLYLPGGGAASGRCCGRPDGLLDRSRFCLG